MQPLRRSLRNPVLVTCARCGKQTAGQRNRRYCSRACYRLAWNKARRARLASDRFGGSRSPGTTPGTCVRCGEPFIGHRDRRYCSARCAEAERRASRREYDRSRSVEYRRSHAAQILERRKHWKPQGSVQRQWRERNRERVLAAHRRYREKDPERRRALERQRYAQNVEKRRASQRAWAKKNLPRRAHLSAARRARELRAEGTHSLADWVALVARHQGCCAYCGRADLPLTRDHIVPLIEGGTNSIDNIVPACRPCNARKGRWARDRFEKLRRDGQ